MLMFRIVGVGPKILRRFDKFVRPRLRCIATVQRSAESVSSTDYVLAEEVNPADYNAKRVDVIVKNLHSNNPLYLKVTFFDDVKGNEIVLLADEEVRPGKEKRFTAALPLTYRFYVKAPAETKYSISKVIVY